MTTQGLAEIQQEELQGELLTPGAAAHLFGISESAVRAARLRGNVVSPVVMGLSGKTVHLIDIRSALEFWGESRAPDPHELDRLRRNGVQVSAKDEVFHLLHSQPVLDRTP